MINLKTYHHIRSVIASQQAGLRARAKQSDSSVVEHFQRDCFAHTLWQLPRLAMTILISILLFTSCEKKIDWEIQQENLNTIVVDAIITNEYKSQHIRLTRPYSDPNGEAISVNNATVIVYAGTNLIIPFFESSEYPGNYYTQIPIPASINFEYTLEIHDDTSSYFAEADMIPVSNANTPTFDLDNETGLYKINWQASAYDPYEQAMLEATIDWQHLLPEGTEDSLASAKIMFYTLNTIDVSYNIFPQDKEEVLFPAGAIAIVKKYSVTDEYGNFLRALLAETEWQGSLFEDARGNLPGNISNGGLGYFSVCSVLSDTLIIQ